MDGIVLRMRSGIQAADGLELCSRLVDEIEGRTEMKWRGTDDDVRCGVQRSRLGPAGGWHEGIHPPARFWLEAFEEREQVVRWLVATRSSTHRSGPVERPLLKGRVRVDVRLRRVDALMAEPQGDHRDVDAGV